MLPLRGAYRNYVRWMMPDLSEDERELDTMVDGLLLARQCYGMAPKVNPRQLTDAELSGIQVPALYVVGERDVICADPRAAVAHVGTLAPQIETFLVPDAGHEAYAMQPKQVTDRVLAFLGT